MTSRHSSRDTSWFGAATVIYVLLGLAAAALIIYPGYPSSPDPPPAVTCRAEDEVLVAFVNDAYRQPAGAQFCVHIDALRTTEAP